jgi:AraC family transcriptional regulator of adaptative response/methylated-DNA-[protein]-cysteine methyltransferase
MAEPMTRGGETGGGETTAAGARDPRWTAVLARDGAWDGAFVYAVTSTGIYCRPSCPSRRPRADRACFFADGAAARAAGFRACRRCAPDDAAAASPAVRLVATALARLADEPVPTLAALAAVCGVSASHLQRTFTRLVGVSPPQWTQAQRAGRLRDGLRRGATVSQAAFDAGFGSLPAAYAASMQHLGMPPGAVRRGGAGEGVFYAIVPCALGQLLVAVTRQGVCRVALDDDAAALEALLREELPRAALVGDDPLLRAMVDGVVAIADGAPGARALPLDLRGTAFQLRVWRELTRIPRGETVTYAELARRIGAPGAVRAVGSACGANPAALVVPCHRVVRSDGGLGGYRWGVERKRVLLEAEQDTASRG